jgi:hypothetical protein
MNSTAANGGRDAGHWRYNGPMEPREASLDQSLKGILLINAITLVVALWQDWSVLQLMWPFWMQSMIIGWYARQRILKLTEFSTEGFKINNRAVDPTPKTQRFTANFFAFHYGFFHLGYLLFLITMTLTTDPGGYVAVTHESTGETSQMLIGHVHPLDFVIFVLLAWGFLKAHRASHNEHVEADLRNSPNIGTLMFLPYARIIPMHLTIVLALPLGGGALWFFVLLKTAADVIMHKVEHRLLQSSTR